MIAALRLVSSDQYIAAAERFADGQGKRLKALGGVPRNPPFACNIIEDHMTRLILFKIGSDGQTEERNAKWRSPSEWPLRRSTTEAAEKRL